MAILIALIFSKYFYLASLISYYTFYLIARFHVSVQSAQVHLFVFLGAVALGTVVGGPVGDRIGRKYVIWCSILGVLPFTLALPYANLFWTEILSVIIGLVLASAFSAILVYAQDLLPGRVGMVSGLFFGLAFGMGGVGAALLGKLADARGIEFVYRVCAFLPAIGLLTAFLPSLGQKRVDTEPLTSPPRRPDRRQQHARQCDERKHRGPAHAGRAVPHLDAMRSARHRDAAERIIGAQYIDRFAVERGLPSGIPVVGEHQHAGAGGRRIQAQVLLVNRGENDTRAVRAGLRRDRMVEYDSGAQVRRGVHYDADRLLLRVRHLHLSAPPTREAGQSAAPTPSSLRNRRKPRRRHPRASVPQSSSARYRYRGSGAFHGPSRHVASGALGRKPASEGMPYQSPKLNTRSSYT